MAQVSSGRRLREVVFRNNAVVSRWCSEVATYGPRGSPPHCFPVRRGRSGWSVNSANEMRFAPRPPSLKLGPASPIQRIVQASNPPSLRGSKASLSSLRLAAGCTPSCLPAPPHVDKLRDPSYNPSLFAPPALVAVGVRPQRRGKEPPPTGRS